MCWMPKGIRKLLGHVPSKETFWPGGRRKFHLYNAALAKSRSCTCHHGDSFGLSPAWVKFEALRNNWKIHQRIATSTPDPSGDGSRNNTCLVPRFRTLLFTVIRDMSSTNYILPARPRKKNMSLSLSLAFSISSAKLRAREN